MESIKINTVITFFCILSSIICNLIINHDFSHNQVDIGKWAVFNNTYGWICNTLCQFNQCHLSNSSADCKGNYLDLDSIAKYQKITQLINIEQKGIYRLAIKYFHPRVNHQNKTFQVYLNSQRASSISTNLSDPYSSNIKVIDQQIIVSHGINNITLTMSGGSPNGRGFLIKNVSLIFIKPLKIQTSFNKLMDYSFNNSLTSSLMKTPGGRVIWTNFVIFFANFDRFQLYIFHNRSYSQNSLIFIKKVNGIKQLQIDVLKDMARSIKSNIVQAIEGLKQIFKFKNGQQESIEMQRVSQRIQGFEDGFIENQFDFLFYKVLSMCILFGVLKFLFHALYNYPVSLILRKFFFYWTLFILIIEGNIQQLAFYLSKEVKLLCSYCLSQKMTNIFVIISLYIVVLASIALFIIFFAKYKKIIKYFQQNCKANLHGIVVSTIDRGVVCLLFGFAHRLLINQPNIQLFVLMAIQGLWIISRLTFLCKKAYQSKLLIIIWVIEGFLRIMIQLSFYLYQNFEQKRQFLNDFHEQLIKVYIYFMILQLLINFFEMSREIINIVKRIYNYSLKTNQICDQNKMRKGGDKKDKKLENGKTNKSVSIKKDQQINNKQKQKVKNQEINLQYQTIQFSNIGNISNTQTNLNQNNRYKGFQIQENFPVLIKKSVKFKTSPMIKEDALLVIRQNNNDDELAH